MAGAALPWCVRHRDGWCATYRGRKPDPDAWSDKTRCGHFVILRWGSERRMPTCSDCLKTVKAGRARRQAS